MDGNTLARYRTALLSLKDDLVREGSVPVEPARRDPTKGADEDEQPLAEMLQVIASNRNRSRAGDLVRIDRALRKIAEAPDSFGLCEECEEEIARRRLQAMPFVERCLDCQAASDAPVGGTRRHLTDFR